MSASLVAEIENLHECSFCCRYRESDMSAPLVADIGSDRSAFFVVDIEEFTHVLLLLQIKKNLYECSSCCRYRGSYTSASLDADIVDFTQVLTLLQI